MVMLSSSKICLAALVMCAAAAHAQTENAPAADLPKGQVIFQSHGEPPAPDSDRKTLTANVTPVAVSDRERAALTFTAYDLDARITPATARLAMRARVTLRNDGAEPMLRVPLQISSTLTWESLALVAGSPLTFEQHVMATDADHTGSATEAVVTLPHALAPGASVTLDAFYSGTIAQNGERLLRLGATEAQAKEADWDAIAPGQTLLRGFGNVLWYPVASPPLFLGDAAKLVQAIGRTKLREATAGMRLRVAVEYRGEPPVTAYFDGETKTFTATNDNAAMPGGIATAEFASQPIGFRAPALMIVSTPASAIAGPGNAEEPLTTLSLVTTDSEVADRLSEVAKPMETMLAEWLGARPATALTVIDHPGQPFEDGALLVAPLTELEAPQAAGALMHSLTHAWVQTGQPWMDEGLAQFFSLLWTEQRQGRPAMVEQLAQLLQPLGVVEPNIASAAEIDKGPPGQPLIAAADEMFYRRKAAAVWMMLRDLAGDEALKLALQSLRAQPSGNASPREEAVAFEKVLEKTSGKDLAWFFNDWVLRDLGLPDLSIVDVTPRNLPAGAGHDSGWLVAVTVHNDGAATADVPLVIRSGSYSTTKHVRVAGFSNTTARVLVEAAPTEVVLNDGVTPELRTSVHTLAVTIHAQ